MPILKINGKVVEVDRFKERRLIENYRRLENKKKLDKTEKRQKMSIEKMFGVLH